MQPPRARTGPVTATQPPWTRTGPAPRTRIGGMKKGEGGGELEVDPRRRLGHAAATVVGGGGEGAGDGDAASHRGRGPEGMKRGRKLEDVKGRGSGDLLSRSLVHAGERDGVVYERRRSTDNYDRRRSARRCSRPQLLPPPPPPLETMTTAAAQLVAVAGLNGDCWKEASGVWPRAAAKTEQRGGAVAGSRSGERATAAI
uniref:Uncharacterized protein n=1 Tax=Oryza sativa subsp. japonica TaxID=39947 RepID=Q9FWL9_ORYSJ|nr:hypothetical protein [Oryza sativa Japonica Group]